MRLAATDGGFELPEAKSQVSYKDRDTLLVGGVFGDADMTDSGYPRTVYEWKRGTPLAEAKMVYEGDREDVSVSGFAYLDRGKSESPSYSAAVTLDALMHRELFSLVLNSPSRARRPAVRDARTLAHILHESL